MRIRWEIDMKREVFFRLINIVFEQARQESYLLYCDFNGISSTKKNRVNGIKNFQLVD